MEKPWIIPNVDEAEPRAELLLDLRHQFFAIYLIQWLIRDYENIRHPIFSYGKVPDLSLARCHFEL